MVKNKMQNSAKKKAGSEARDSDLDQRELYKSNNFKLIIKY
jgi:hypothetical protein